jgi:uncharacterized membrane protein YdfJ with MMPL/SSD domain
VSNQTKLGHLVTILIWVIAATALGTSGVLLGIRTSLPGPSSQEEVRKNLGESLAAGSGMILTDTLLVTLQHPRVVIDDEEFRAAREDLFDLLKKATSAHSNSPLFKVVQTPGHTWLPSDRLVSPDQKSVLFLAETAVPRSIASGAMGDLPDLLTDWSSHHPSFQLHYLSNGTADNEMFQLIDSDLDNSLIVTLPLTLLVLLWSFGSVIAALVPLCVALVSLAASLGVTAILSTIFGPVSATAAQLVVLLVLAVGIDYSLFFVSRMREEISRGVEPHQAALATRSAIVPAVAWSGVTVALSLVGLLLMQDAVLTSMALVSLASVGVTVAGTLVAVPSIIALLANRFGRTTKRQTQSTDSRRTLLTASLSRPWLVFVLTVSGLLSLSLLCFSMRLGSTVQPETLPTVMQSARAYEVLERSFPALAGPDFAIVLAGKDLRNLEDEGLLQPFFDQMNASATVTGPLAVDTSVDGTMMRYHFRAVGSSNDVANKDLVRRINDELFPRLLAPLGVSGWLSGTLPFSVTEAAGYRRNFPRVFAGVLVLSLLFLLLAFRSLVIPLKAILLNILSTTASFGVLVLIFQYLPTPWQYGEIESFVPALLFSILFGLSMDYHVFLVARMTEERDKGLAPEEAIRNGVTATARTVTSAALIMISVFCAIASLRLPIMKQLGTGLAIAVLLDATVVRTMLLPASMLLLGEWNWHLPRWLDWLPRLRVH